MNRGEREREREREMREGERGGVCYVWGWVGGF